MLTSTDYFPDGELKLHAVAQPTQGNPLRLEFSDDGRLVHSFTIFTRSAALAIRLEHAINFVMQYQGQALTRAAVEEVVVKALDPIEEIIGPNERPSSMGTDPQEAFYGPDAGAFASMDGKRR